MRSPASRPAPKAASASAPRLRVVVDHHRDVEPLAQLGRRGHADPAGQDRGRADGALAALVDRAREAHAGADHGLARDARVGERLDHELGGHLQALGRVVVGVERARALGEDRARQVRDGDAQVRVAEVHAHGGARRWRRRRAGSAGGRPARRRPSPAPGARRRGRRPAGRRPGSRPWNGESPVRRAMSAREIWPSSRSARITRRRLRRRSDSSEPARPGGMKSVPLERERDGPST